MNERGALTILGSAVGAVLTAAPILLVAATSAAEDGLVRLGAVFVAIGAIGVGVGKVWQLVRAASRKLDALDQIEANQHKILHNQSLHSNFLREWVAAWQRNVDRTRIAEPWATNLEDAPPFPTDLYDS
jgi:uncharacterized protein YoxC